MALAKLCQWKEQIEKMYQSIINMYKTKDNDSVMFIMFPGYGNSAKQWDFDTEKKAYTSNFLSKLGKLGNVHTLTCPWDNIIYHRDPLEKEYFDPEIEFVKDDLNIESFCKKVYGDVKDFKGYFVPIGHSIGAHYVYKFCELFSDQCLFSVILDGNPMGPFWLNGDRENVRKYSESSYDDPWILGMREKIYRGDKEAMSELRRFCMWQIIGQRKYEENALKVKTFFFRSLKTDQTGPGYNALANPTFLDEIEYWKSLGPGMFEVVIFYDKTHWIHYDAFCRNVILGVIKNEVLRSTA